MDFKPGNRVVYLGHPRLHLGVEKGELGTVLYSDTRHSLVCVRWDTFHKRRHTCNGLCESGYGWNVDPKFITHAIEDLGDFLPNTTPDAINDLLGGCT